MRYGTKFLVTLVCILTAISSCMRDYDADISQEPTAKYPAKGNDTLFQSYISEPNVLAFKDAVLFLREYHGIARVDNKIIRYTAEPIVPEEADIAVAMKVDLTECSEKGIDSVSITDEGLRERYINKIDSMITAPGN